MDAADIRHTVLIALVILGGALLRLFMLTNQSLWYDEGLSLVVTDSKTLSGTFDALAARTGGDKYQPLYFFVLSVWRSLIGDSEFSLRIMSVLPGVVALFFMYATVANTYGSRHAFWSTSYLTVSAFWICYSQEVRPYSLLFALGAIQLFLLSSIFTDSDQPKPARLALFALITGVSCFASVLLAVFTVSMAIAHATINRNARNWLMWWSPALLACTPAIIYILGTPAINAVTVDSTNGLGMPLYKNSLFAIYGILVGHTYGPPLEALRANGNITKGILEHGWVLMAFAIACLVLFAGFISAYKALVKRGAAGHSLNAKPTHFFLILLLCSFCMAILVAKVTAINWMPRHSFYLSIPLAILLPLAFSGQHLSSGSDTTTQSVINRSAMVAFVWLLAMNLYASYNYFYKSEYWRDDYRSAADYLATELNEMDRAIMLWGEPRLLSYYGDSTTQKYWAIDPSPVSTVMDGVHSAGGHVFVAINREFTWSRGTSENLQTQVAEKYNLISVKRYVNFNIYEFENIAPRGDIVQPPINDNAKIQSM